MKKNNFFLFGIAVLTILTFMACKKEATKTTTASTLQTSPASMIGENGANPDETMMTISNDGGIEMIAINSEGERRNPKGHFLYTESNEAGTNRIYVYKINSDGSLTSRGSTASGGAGKGAGLGSQGALALSEDNEWLFAVNAGSNSVSSFKVNSDGNLTLSHTENSGGDMPVSVSAHGNLLYVLNYSSDNIHGFKVGDGGTLDPIENSTQSLSGTGVAPPQITFTPNGDWLIVTEKATNKISSFKVKHDGSVGPDLVTASTGQTPFGFDFGRDDILIVSNAAGGTADAGSATSYRISGNGVPQEINGAVANHQAAPCWVATTRYGRFAFVTNTASNSISSYYIAPEGYLFLIDKAAAATDNGPIDIVVAKNNFNVYALNAKSGTIGEYHRKYLGGLEIIGKVAGLPGPTTGLVTF